METGTKKKAAKFILLLTTLISPRHVREAGVETAEQAHAIAVDAYIYIYPPVTMDVSRKQFTNVEAGKEFGKGPMNMFTNVPEYPPASFRASYDPTSTRSTPLRGWT